MIAIRRILCPVDLSVHSRHALDHAIALARWYDASVAVLHVLDPVSSYAPGGPGFPSALPGTDDRSTLEAELQAFVERDVSQGVAIERVVREGDAVRQILAFATEMAADLLVVGTHGRSGFERLVLGSVTEKLLRRAECPVLSVPPRAADASLVATVTYKRILCPIDFSRCSMNALTLASSLAQEADAHLTLLHVMEYYTMETEVYETSFDERLSVDQYRRRCQAISRGRLETAVSQDARQYCTVDTLLAEGKPYREILRVAAEQQSEIIIMGVRGRGTVDLMLFGSTTQHVVRQATCPVLTVRQE